MLLIAALVVLVASVAGALWYRASSRPLPVAPPPAIEEAWLPPVLPSVEDTTFHRVFTFHQLIAGSPQVPTFSTWRGLVVHGPRIATLTRADPSGPEIEARVVVCVAIALPGRLARETWRAQLFVEDTETSQRHHNAIEALCQGLGLSISRTFVPHGPPIAVTQQSVLEPDRTTVTHHANPNLALLGLRGGRRYRAWAQLDEVRSNVIEFETVGEIEGDSQA